MRIEAFLRQSPVFQASRIARRTEASLNAILQEEELTFFEALMLAAIFFEKKGGIKPSEANLWLAANCSFNRVR